jgi:NAD(P)H-hydrate repair Nnr-like enzyme with NAD(P)H-hydrate dehydratase domain
VSVFYASAGSGGVVSGVEVSPIRLALGCILLAAAVMLTKRVASRVANRASRAVEAGDLLREAAMVGLVISMLAGTALIGWGLFEYR